MLLNCLTHFPSVRVAITNVAVIRTLERAGRNTGTERDWHAAPEKDLAGVIKWGEDPVLNIVHPEIPP